MFLWYMYTLCPREQPNDQKASPILSELTRNLKIGLNRRSRKNNLDLGLTQLNGDLRCLKKKWNRKNRYTTIDFIQYGRVERDEIVNEK